MQTIRPANSNDAAAILAIQKRAFEDEARLCGDPEIPPLTETLDAVLAHIETQTVLAACDGEQVIGSVRGLVSGTVCTIRGLSIEPGYQGRGIGTALLLEVERAHPLATSFALNTNAAMQGNVRFYRRHGYAIAALTQYSERITLASMSKLGVAADA